MSLKTRIQRLEERHFSGWEAPLFFINSDEDARRVEVERERYREEIERDLARGREIIVVDFRPAHKRQDVPGEA